MNKIQIGKSIEANFQKNIWKFKMPNDFKVTFGEYYIIQKELYEQICSDFHDIDPRFNIENEDTHRKFSNLEKLLLGKTDE